MKKDKEWLKEEVEDLQIYSNPEVRADRSDPYTQYVGGVNDAVSRVKELLDQLDEPEKIIIPQFVADWIEEMKQDKRPLYSVMSTLMNKTNHEWAIWKSANMNFSEIVAQAWLDGYQFEKEKLYKVVIPQSVADWWERDDDSVTMYGRLRVEKKHKFDLISIFYDKGLGDYLSKVEDWFYENDSIFLDLVNGKPYEVEEEQKYYVRDENDTLLCKSNGVVMTVGKLWAIGNEHEAEYDLTEKEIKDYDERYWQFAVEVAE